MNCLFKIMIVSVVLLGISQRILADSDKETKILIIGVDGVINSAIDYASTSAIDDLLDNATYNMNSYGGVPAYSSTGWATILTGVSSNKHLVTSEGSFDGNDFEDYPSVVSRIKDANSSTMIASIVRDAYINNELNTSADYKFDFSTDDEVFDKALEIIEQDDIDVEFVQFSSPQEAGEDVGYQLREADYVLAIQQVDDYVGQLVSAIKSRDNYDSENWSVYFVSTHGGTSTGEYTNNTVDEMEVPVIFSGDDFDNKELDPFDLDATDGSDNVLTINKASSGDYTYVRVPIDGTALQGMDKYTIEMWIKAGDDNSSDPSIIGDKNWDSGGNPGFVICRSGTKWKINFANQNSSRYDIGKGAVLEDDEWHHIAVTFDKTNECIVYQDGEVIASEELSYSESDDMTSPYNYICLAQDGTESYGGGSPNWSGTYNEVRIWTDVLSQQTIQDYMYLRDIENSDHPNLESLNLYLKMDEVSGSVIKDYSGKGNNGELIGSATVRNLYYPLSLTDVTANILSQLGIDIDSSWGIDGNALKSNVPYRLYKVN